MQRGTATTEYVILLMAIAIIALALVLNYGQTLKAKWQGDDGAGLSAVTDTITADPSDSGDGCNYYFNPATGRWHDPDTNLFVSFDSASAAGC
jgi:ABC-type cobalt transport system substrate-binding protein